MDVFMVQMEITRGKPALNQAKVLALTAGIKVSQPGLVVLPELFSTGYLDISAMPSDITESTFSDGIDAASLNKVSRQDRAFFASLSLKLGCWVAGSTVEAGPPGELGNGGFRNLSLWYSPEGKEIGSYHKIHPFSYGGEDQIFSKGNEIATLDIEGWIIQPTICYDLRFPELYRAGSKRGVHLIIVQANWPTARQSHWDTLLRARAIENQAYVVGVNCCGVQGTLEFIGGSTLISPKGDILALGDDSEMLVRGNADMEFCLHWRKQFPALRDRRDSDFYP